MKKKEVTVFPHQNRGISHIKDLFDWAGCPDDRRSTSVYSVYIGFPLFSWPGWGEPQVKAQIVDRMVEFDHEAPDFLRYHQRCHYFRFYSYEKEDGLQFAQAL